MHFLENTPTSTSSRKQLRLYTQKNVQVDVYLEDLLTHMSSTNAMYSCTYRNKSTTISHTAIIAKAPPNQLIRPHLTPNVLTVWAGGIV